MRARRFSLTSFAVCHEAVPALFLHLFRHGAGEVVGRRAGDRLVAEAADAGELGLAHPVEQELEVLLGLAGEADDEGRADGEVGAHLAPAADALQRLLLRARGGASPSSTVGEACWKGMSR